MVRKRASTTSAGLTKPLRKRKVSSTSVPSKRKDTGAGSGVTVELLEAIDIRKVSQLLQQDRLDRGLTWPAYADFLGVPQATVYKIARGAHQRPHQLTLAKILGRINAAPAPGRSAGGAGGATASEGPGSR